MRVLSTGRLFVLGLLVSALVGASVPWFAQKPVMAAVPPVLDDDVVLPSRVAAAMDRTASALDRSGLRIIMRGIIGVAVLSARSAERLVRRCSVQMRIQSRLPLG